MTNGECINRKIVDYMSRIALEKDDFRRFVREHWEFRVTGNWVRGARCIKVENGPLTFFKALVYGGARRAWPHNYTKS